MRSDTDVDVLVDTGNTVFAQSPSPTMVNTSCLRTNNPVPESWPTIASPPRYLDETFNCEVESPLLSLVKVISEVSDTPPAATANTPHGGYYSRERHTSTESQFTLSECLDQDPLHDPAVFSGFLASPTPKSHHLGSSPISRVFRFTGNSPREGLCIRTVDLNDEQTLQYRTPCQTFSTLPSPIFAPPSPSCSSFGDPISPSNSFTFFRRQFRLRSPGNDSPTRPKNLFNATDENFYGPPSPSAHSSLPDSVPCSPLTATAPVTLPRRRRLNSSTTISTISSVASCSPAPTIHPSKTPKTPNFEYLPAELSWLKEISLELWIDQEGFRAIKPSFKLVGYSEITRSLEPFGRDSDPVLQPDGTPKMYAGIVDFMPVTRQIFIYHRSALDSAPVLRRITVNGDEGYDYLSRQASLPLKNGIYTVRGHETCSLASLNDSTDLAISDKDANVRPRWKLEYFVQDRKAKTSGKIMNGEKTFTPLTFSCSPLLLHSLQGKKVRLMHVVRKSVTTKIMAEKLEPPKPPISNPVLLPFGLKANMMLSPNIVHPPTNDAWNMHRRAYSHVPDENMSPNLPLASKRIERQANNAKPVRRRRASSAGEHAFEGRGFDEDESKTPAPARNILPRSQVNELFIPSGYRAEDRFAIRI
jgi:hypothetical protein